VQAQARELGAAAMTPPTEPKPPRKG